ncbi:hypothetical protein K457DRAFT_683579 [Linnemannia elongata AG-77]|uniref:F-box domain-containing protein n=1 Tax=Linnemannia elongata AG-77 TaxID=1314771 RepID=A0A197JQ27_9FUNG|nr:hypothetical protein K457DRAFT_683579 [Linnemannia elongata AG-77]
MDPIDPVSFSSLPPEIVPLIATSLNRHDLAQCVRVCHQWLTLFTPSLWRNVKADSWFCDNKRILILIRNSQFIRHLELGDGLVADILGLVQFGRRSVGVGLLTLVASFEQETPSSFPRLTLLGDGAAGVEQEQEQEQQQEDDAKHGNARTLGMLLQASDNLKSLTVDETCFRFRDGTDAFLLIIGCCPTRALERLEIRFGHHPAFATLTAENDENTIYTALEAWAPEAGTLGVFEALKELVLFGGDSHIAALRVGFLTRCPSLERVQLNNIDEVAMVSLGVAFNKCCHQLSHLDWRGPSRGFDDEIAVLISSAKSHWKEISLPDMDAFGPKAFAALMESVRTRLEVLKVNGWGDLQGPDFLDLLCSAQHLRRLEGPADGRVWSSTTELTMWAYSAFYQHTHGKDRSWALGPSLEFLQIWIDDVPRPDIVCRRNGDPLPPNPDVPEGGGDVYLRYDVQRWVYTQLRRLTGLQELILGVRELDPKVLLVRSVAHLSYDPIPLEESLRHVAPTFIYRSLEFSLDSGLEMLAELKELRVLDVKSTAHRIGVTELDWMHVNWPKLKTIRGLESKREWAGDVADGLAIKAAVDAWMADHPNGIGSCY